MKYYLLKIKDIFADEFDLHGYLVLTESEYNNYLEQVEQFKKGFKYNYYYFGTNEFLRYESAKDVLSDITIREITKDQYDGIESAGLKNFGYIIPYDIIMNKDEWEVKDYYY